jgi:hypothetical protein
VQQPPKIRHALALPRPAYVMTLPPRHADPSGGFQGRGSRSTLPPNATACCSDGEGGMAGPGSRSLWRCRGRRLALLPLHLDLESAGPRFGCALHGCGSRRPCKVGERCKSHGAGVRVCTRAWYLGLPILPRTGLFSFLVSREQIFFRFLTRARGRPYTDRLFVLFSYLYRPTV